MGSRHALATVCTRHGFTGLFLWLTGFLTYSCEPALLNSFLRITFFLTGHGLRIGFGRSKLRPAGQICPLCLASRAGIFACCRCTREEKFHAARHAVVCRAGNLCIRLTPRGGMIPGACLRACIWAADGGAPWYYLEHSLSLSRPVWRLHM